MKLKDQAAHFVAGFCFGLLAGDVLTGLIAGFLAGLVREFTEWQLASNRGKYPWKGHGSILSSGSILDLTFWILGGSFGGVV